jgi:hypothetical protein
MENEKLREEMNRGRASSRPYTITLSANMHKGLSRRNRNTLMLYICNVSVR